jgi:hypothetical protein
VVQALRRRYGAQAVRRGGDPRRTGADADGLKGLRNLKTAILDKSNKSIYLMKVFLSQQDIEKDKLSRNSHAIEP